MDECFVVILGILIGVFLRWAFKTLPGEGWQILASVPLVKLGPSTWRGINFTYYGLLIAVAVITANAIMLLLLGTIHVPLANALMLQQMTLLICLPCARWIARKVENRAHTFSIGGAAFVGIVLAPLLIWLTNKIVIPVTSSSLPLVPTLAAMTIAYAFGEGLGRVACISFGCCYGKPLATAAPWVKKLFGSFHFVFEGKTKKVAYEAGMEGSKLIPVQGLTSVCLVTTGLLSMIFYLKGYYSTALAISFFVTQGWRAFSETLRADWRGGGVFSAYQIMAVVSLVCAGIFLWVNPVDVSPKGQLIYGLLFLWDPGVILVLIGVGIAAFIYTGKSTVTTAELTFGVVKEKI